jgi:hypothetical protein
MDDLKDNLLKFRNFNHIKIKILNLLFLIFFSVPLIIFLVNSNFANNVNLDSSSNFGQASGCRIQINNENYVDTNITNYPIDIYIIPEVSNLKCLGTPYVANYSVDGETLNIEYKVASNYKLFRYSSNIGNYLLILLLIVNKKRLIYYPVLIYFVFNLGIYNLFTPTEPVSEIFFPVAPFYGERFIKFFVNNLFLIVLSLKIDSNKVYLSLFTFFCFVSIDFVGIFIFLLFFKNKLEFNFSENEKKYLLALPVGFYILRIISGIFTYLDDVWISLAQTIYRGYTRYADMQRTLFFLKCNADPNATIVDGYFPGIQCDNMGGGPLDAYLPFYGNVNTWSKIIGSISTLLLILFYFKALKYFRENQIIVSLFFLSPPLIHLTHYGNDDFMILLICLYSLWNFKKNTLLKILLILITALFNLHPTSILLGLLVVSVKKSDYKVFFNTFSLLIIFSALFFYDLINNEHHIAVMPWGDYGFGVYLDAINLKSSFSVDYIFGFMIIFIICLLILTSKSFIQLYKNVNFEKMYSSETKFGEYAILSISFWYVVTFLYSNVGYRLPSFYLLFLLLYFTNDYKIKALIIGLVFLEPVIWHSEIFVRNIFQTVNNICHYIIFLVCAKFLFLYTIEQLKKLINDFKNKKIYYIDS